MKPDLAVANGNSANVSVLLGTGTGTFGAATNFPAGTGPFSITNGDFNADGKMDLAIANYITAGTASVLINCTSGVGIVTFGSKQEISIYPNPANSSFVLETGNTEKQTVNIFDITGKVVLSKIINGNSTLDIRSLNEGVYIVNINNSEGLVNKRLVIVR